MKELFNKLEEATSTTATATTPETAFSFIQIQKSDGEMVPEESSSFAHSDQCTSPNKIQGKEENSAQSPIIIGSNLLKVEPRKILKNASTGNSKPENTSTSNTVNFSDLSLNSNSQISSSTQQIGPSRKISSTGKQSSKDSVTFDIPCPLGKFDEISKEFSRKCSTGTGKGSIPFIDRSIRSDSSASGHIEVRSKSSFSSVSQMKTYLKHIYSRSLRGSQGTFKEDIYEECKEDENAQENADTITGHVTLDSHSQDGSIRQKSKCRPLWWKFFTCLSAIMFAFAIIGFSLGVLMPRKPIDGHSSDEIKAAVEFNYTWEILKLVGAILFCLGALTSIGI